MIKEALQYMIELGHPGYREIGGRVYASKKVEEIVEPAPDMLVTSTLTGVIDYVVNISGELNRDLVIFVVNSREVQLFTRLKDTRRWWPLMAKCPSRTTWNWGRFMGQEEFIIAAKANFGMDDELQQLLGIVSNLTEDNQTESIDTGITQKVNVKHGVNIVADNLPTFLKLRQDDWWPDVAPPPIECFLRVQKGLKVALFATSNPNREFVMRTMVAEFLKRGVEDYFAKLGHTGLSIPVVM